MRPRRLREAIQAVVRDNDELLRIIKQHEEDDSHPGEDRIRPHEHVHGIDPSLERQDLEEDGPKRVDVGARVDQGDLLVSLEAADDD